MLEKAGQISAEEMRTVTSSQKRKETKEVIHLSKAAKNLKQQNAVKGPFVLLFFQFLVNCFFIWPQHLQQKDFLQNGFYNLQSSPDP